MPEPVSLILPLADLLAQLQASDRGLSSAEAKKRMAVCGANEVKPKQDGPLKAVLQSLVGNPLTVILLSAAVAS
ncbi:cation-transporting P-type ATPase, partial [Acinetobacter baumannii]